MGKTLMLLPSLLVLVVSIQVSYSCTCEPRTFEEAMSHSDTVVSAFVEEEQLLDEDGKVVFVKSMAASAKYQMYLDKSYKNGSKPLFVNDLPFFDVVVPWEENLCGHPLIIDRKYILSGTVTKEALLNVNKCELISLVEEHDPDEKASDMDYF